MCMCMCMCLAQRDMSLTRRDTVLAGQPPLPPGPPPPPLSPSLPASPQHSSALRAPRQADLPPEPPQEPERLSPAELHREASTQPRARSRPHLGDVLCCVSPLGVPRDSCAPHRRRARTVQRLRLRPRRLSTELPLPGRLRGAFPEPMRIGRSRLRRARPLCARAAASGAANRRVRRPAAARAVLFAKHREGARHPGGGRAAAGHVQDAHPRHMLHISATHMSTTRPRCLQLFRDTTHLHGAASSCSHEERRPATTSRCQRADLHRRPVGELPLPRVGPFPRGVRRRLGAAKRADRAARHLPLASRAQPAPPAPADRSALAPQGGQRSSQARTTCRTGCGSLPPRRSRPAARSGCASRSRRQPFPIPPSRARGCARR